MTTKRKPFYFKNDEEKPIIAGGVILYKIEKEKIYLLLIDSKGYYQDLGGKINNTQDLKDSENSENSENSKNLIFDLISKEVNRDSNFILDENSIKKRLITAKSAYTQQSKYIVYVIKANDEESKLTSEYFSQNETDVNISRRIKWVLLDSFIKPNIIKHKVSVRLKNTYFFDILKNIKKDMLEWEIFS